MDTLQVDDGFHSDGGSTPPPSPSSSGSSLILSTTSDHAGISPFYSSCIFFKFFFDKNDLQMWLQNKFI